MNKHTTLIEEDTHIMEDRNHDLASVDSDNLDGSGDLPGIIVLLGELKPSAIITEEGAARLFNRHVASVKRAVQRGELPPPCRLFGGNAWTAGAIVQHIEKRLDQAAQEAKREADKIARLSP
jgi:hypothetical protein